MLRTVRKQRALLGAVTGLTLSLAATGCGGEDDATDTAQEIGTGTETAEEVTPEDTEAEAEQTEDAPELAGGEQALRADLAELNGSGATGVAQVEVADGQVLVTVQADGVAADAPHAQHIHIGGENTCPTPDAAGDDEFISTPEGQPAYGGIAVSLTVDGATDAASALAVERFPTADGEGTLTYSRSFDLPEGTTADDLSNGVIVVHGVADTTLGEDPAAYDGPDSELKEGVPEEATLPALCGALESVDGPTGDAGTGTETESTS
ncbi:MAG: hypothetical protein KY461_09285 [Actinobacteria bacterium]|nr:hypothetical protein [Actinomycetota bacterium]